MKKRFIICQFITSSIVILLLSCIGHTPAHAQSPNWQRLNGPYGGSVMDIRGGDSTDVFVLTSKELDKLDVKTGSWIQLYAGLSFNFTPKDLILRNSSAIAIPNGWIETYNGGKLWTSTGSTILYDIMTAGFVIDDTVYAGTGAHGVVKTYSLLPNGSLSYWEQTDTSHWPVYSLIRDSSNVMFAGSMGIVYRSSNRGATWTPMKQGLPTLNVTALFLYQGSVVAGTQGAGAYLWDAPSSSWIPMNPGMEPWAISSFALRGGMLFVSSLDAGVFVYNGPNNWSEFNTGFHVNTVSKLFLRTNGELLAGTSEGVYTLPVGGSAWQQIGLPETQVLGMAETPTHDLITQSTAGLSRSTDFGDTWSDISIDATNWAVGGIARSNSGTLVALSKLGIYRSRDNGQHWNADTISLGQTSYSNVGNPSIYYAGGSQFLMCNGIHTYSSSNDGVSWTSRGSSPMQFSGSGTKLFGASYSGVYRSNDNGAAWELVFKSGTVTARGNDVLISNSSDTSYYSSDAGTTWSNAYVNPNRWYLFADAFAPSGIYFASNAGVLRTHALSEQPSLTNLTGYVSAIAANGTSVIAFDTKRGVFYTTDSGTTWKASRGIYDSVISLMDGDSGIYFASTAAGVYRSTDNGQNFTSSSIGLARHGLGSLVAYACSIAAPPNGHLFAYAMGHGLARSTDRGDHWQLLDTAQKNQSQFAMAPSGRMFRDCMGVSIITNPHLIYSDDEGMTWDTTAHQSFLSWAFDSSGGILGFSDDGSNSSSGYNLYVTYTSDHGITWKQFNDLGSYGTQCLAAVDRFGEIYIVNLGRGGSGNAGGIRTGHDLNNMTEHPDSDSLWGAAIATDKYGYAYLGSKNRIFRSTDGGDTWTLFITIGNAQQNVISLLATDKYLFAGTDGGGITRISYTGSPRASGVYSTTASPDGIEIFPNPFAISTHVEFNVETAGRAEVSILNLLGEEVTHLFSGEMEAGVHTLMWDPKPTLPDGMYECLIRMNGRVEKLPMMLMR